METLIPSVFFLRVEEKFSGDFIHLDKAVRQGPTLLYLQLFRRGYRTGVCRISQGMLAALCKCSVRALQGYIRKLEALSYIQVEPQPDGCHAYRLLLNDRVRLFSDSAFSFEQDAEFSPDQAQNLHMGGANSAPIKRVKELKALTPLSPLPLQRQRLRVNASTHGAFPGTSGDRPLPETSGRGDLFLRGKAGTPFSRPMRPLNDFLPPIPGKRPEKPRGASGISFGDVGNCLPLTACWPFSISSGVRSPGQRNMAASCRMRSTGSVPGVGWIWLKANRRPRPLLLRLPVPAPSRKHFPIRRLRPSGLVLNSSSPALPFRKNAAPHGGCGRPCSARAMRPRRKT